MSYVGIAVISAGVGIAVGLKLALFIFWRMQRRLTKRLIAKGGLLATQADLESRRDVHDYGREEAVREGAGVQAVVREALSVTRPGALSLYNTSKLEG